MRKALPALFALAIAAPAAAGQVRHFVLDTLRASAGAVGHGVAVFPDGSLRPLPPLAEAARFDEPLALALAVAPDGTAYVATGHPARIYRVRGGKKDLVGEVKADQITALLLDPSGTLWAASAVPAELWRLGAHGGRLEKVAALDKGDLWDLAWFEGGVVAAAGDPGRLLRLTPKGLEQAVEVPDKHARCLAVHGKTLFVGTSGKGLVLRWTGDGPPAVLAGSSFTEIAALAVAPDGTAYAAALTGDPTLGKAPPPKDDGEPTVTVTVGPPEASAPQPAAEKGPVTSEVLRILPNGAVTTVQRFAKQLVGALAWGQRGLAIGTGLEGELWQLIDGTAAQLDAVDAAQVVRLAVGGDWVLTQSPAKLLHRSGAPHGTFTSPVLDAAQPAQWGEVDVTAQLPAGTPCTVRFRSGATAAPGDTWNPWSAAQPCGELKVNTPVNRYLQWQLDLSGPPEVAVQRVDVAYRQLNLAPEIKEFTAYDPGVVFLKGPPPSDRVVEVEHPDLSGIFTTIDDQEQERQATLGKRYYRVGYQSLSWKAEDPNGDPLRFTLEVQRAGSDRWWPVRQHLETTVIGIDTSALPDGVYRFRLTASDAPANPDDPLTVQALSSYVTVDNTPPTVTFTRQGEVWLVTVEDALSPLAKVEWNRDADAWHAMVPDDGLLDGRRETFHLPVAKGVHTLAVRAIDDHHNRATAAVEEIP